MSSSSYRDLAKLTRATAVLVRPEHRSFLGPQTLAWLVDDPYLSYARASALWKTTREPWWNKVGELRVADGIGAHRSEGMISSNSVEHGEGVGVPWVAAGEGATCRGAVVAGQDAVIGGDVDFGQGAVLGDGAILGKGVVLGDGVFIGRDAVVGDGTVIGQGAVIANGVVLGQQVVLGERVSVAPGCTLGPYLRVGSGSQLGPGVHIAEKASIGSMVDLRAGVVIEHGCAIGNRVRIHANSVIGADGFGFAPTPESTWVKIEQLGRVVIGDDVEIGALCSIDRGALGDTRIGRGSKLDNQIQIGHNVCIGEHCAIAGCVGIAGSTVLGDRVRVGGGAGILGHLRIADDVVIAAMSLISESISAAGFYGSSYPQMRNADWERSAAIVRQLPQLRRRLMRLEALARVRPDGPASQSRPEPDGEGGASD